jgi:PEP-CTERM motif
MATLSPRLPRRFAAALSVLLFAAHADAGVISGAVTGGNSGGTFVQLTPPPFFSVGNNNFNSPNLFAFNEAQNVTLPGPLTVNVGSSPIPAGTTVSSHYVFFDPAQPRTTIGTVDFDGDVLGIITERGDLIASDFLGLSGITYLSPAARGLESDDLAVISGPRQIRVNLNASNPGDHIRVVTRAVPEPTSLAAFGVGLAGLGVWRARRRSA